MHLLALSRSRSQPFAHTQRRDLMAQVTFLTSLHQHFFRLSSHVSFNSPKVTSLYNISLQHVLLIKLNDILNV